MVSYDPRIRPNFQGKTNNTAVPPEPAQPPSIGTVFKIVSIGGSWSALVLLYSNQLIHRTKQTEKKSFRIAVFKADLRIFGPKISAVLAARLQR